MYDNEMMETLCQLYFHGDIEPLDGLETLEENICSNCPYNGICTSECIFLICPSWQTAMGHAPI